MFNLNANPLVKGILIGVGVSAVGFLCGSGSRISLIAPKPL